jgi:hypothetical protein
MSLGFFHFLLTSLSQIHVSISQSNRVISLCRVRLQHHSSVCDGFNWIVELRDLSSIKVPNSIEVHVSHIGTMHINYFLIVSGLWIFLQDFSVEVILGLFLDISHFIPSIEFILGVFELNLPLQPVLYCSNKDTCKVITSITIFYLPPIMESYYLMSIHN